MEKGRKTRAPQAFCRMGKAMPIRRLHNQYTTLPKDMAAGRGATSKSSEKTEKYIKKTGGRKRWRHTCSDEEGQWTQAKLEKYNVEKDAGNAAHGKPAEGLLKRESKKRIRQEIPDSEDSSINSQ